MVGGPANLEALTAYVTSESRGVKMNVPMRHPKEMEAYRVGEKHFPGADLSKDDVVASLLENGCERNIKPPAMGGTGPVRRLFEAAGKPPI